MEIDHEEEIEIINENSFISMIDEESQNFALQYLDSDICRPQIEQSIYDKSQPFIFMQIDIDNYVSNNKGYLRAFGINKQGNSILCHISDFLAYLYVECPLEWNPSNTNISELQQELNRRGQSQRNINTQLCIDNIQLVKKQSIRLFKGKGYINTNFLQIFVSQPQFASSIKNMFEKGLCFQGITFPCIVFEGSIPYPLRFMVDNNLKGMSWMALKPNSYSFREQQQFQSRCQLEIDVSYRNIIAFQPEGDWSDIPPLRILSFDIECSANKCFPTPQKNEIIQIASICKIHGEDQPFVQTVFTLKKCSEIVGAEVRSFEKEQELLDAWEKFIQVVDPDFLTGYNIINFDLPYILERAGVIGMKNFGQFGKIKGKLSRIKISTYSSKIMGNRETKEINIDGRVQLDMLIHMHQEHKLSSYTLNNVSQYFLKEQKEDLHYSKIYDLQNGTPETRRRIATYCLKDALLPLRLIDKLMAIYNYAEMARVTGVPISYLFTRGQQIKVCSQLLRKTKNFDMILPSERARGSQEKYEGAIVISPKTKYYTTPIATLDFASLYPSIMMAHNLCYCTLIPTGQEKFLHPNEYTRVPSTNYCFVKSSVQKGILPQILEELLNARKQARKELAEASDPFVKAVLDGRQLALKISANSVYGFTGAMVGQLPCLEISSSVTAFGRQMITLTQKLVEEKFNKQNNYKNDAIVIYGDTDSVMVNFGVETVEEAMKLGKEASICITESFIKPIRLEFEKVYYPYLLMQRKRYAGLLWTKPDKYDKMDKKGIESVRRDNCSLIRTVQNNVLDMILIDRDANLAIQYVKTIIKQLLQNKIDLSMLIITKGISKKTQEQDEQEERQNQSKGGLFSQVKQEDKKNVYKAKLPHVELVEKMKKRDPGYVANIGDRIQYVAIPGTKGSKNYENVEDPTYVLENDIPIDFEYYIEKQLKNPLKRIFEHIIPNTEILFSRDHVQNAFVPKINTKSGGMMGKFIQIKQTCMNCKVQLQDQSKALCPNCQHKSPELYLKKLYELNQIERSFAALWTQCQRCQENLHQDVLCENKDCQIFYRRTKVRKDIVEAKKVIQRFNSEW